MSKFDLNISVIYFIENSHAFDLYTGKGSRVMILYSNATNSELQNYLMLVLFSALNVIFITFKLTQDDNEPLCLLGNGVFLRDWRFVCTTTGSCSSHFSLITSLSLSSSPLNTGWIYAL